MRVLILCGLLSVVVACNATKTAAGPPSVNETSDARPDLKARVAFVEQYVVFRRSYKELEYHIVYHDNSGLVPGPSDWDVRLRAIVPPHELDQWVPQGAAQGDAPSSDWMSSIPGEPSEATSMTWYKTSGREVGVHAASSTVVYRNTSM